MNELFNEDKFFKTDKPKKGRNPFNVGHFLNKPQNYKNRMSKEEQMIDNKFTKVDYKLNNVIEYMGHYRDTLLENLEKMEEEEAREGKKIRDIYSGAEYAGLEMDVDLDSNLKSNNCSFNVEKYVNESLDGLKFDLKKIMESGGEIQDIENIIDNEHPNLLTPYEEEGLKLLEKNSTKVQEYVLGMENDIDYMKKLISGENSSKEKLRKLKEAAKLLLENWKLNLQVETQNMITLKGEIKFKEIKEEEEDSDGYIEVLDTEHMKSNPSGLINRTMNQKMEGKNRMKAGKPEEEGKSTTINTAKPSKPSYNINSLNSFDIHGLTRKSFDLKTLLVEKQDELEGELLHQIEKRFREESLEVNKGANIEMKEKFFNINNLQVAFSNKKQIETINDISNENSKDETPVRENQEEISKLENVLENFEHERNFSITPEEKFLRNKFQHLSIEESTTGENHEFYKTFTFLPEERFLKIKFNKEKLTLESANYFPILPSLDFIKENYKKFKSNYLQKENLLLDNMNFSISGEEKLVKNQRNVNLSIHNTHFDYKKQQKKIFGLESTFLTDSSTGISLLYPGKKKIFDDKSLQPCFSNQSIKEENDFLKDDSNFFNKSNFTQSFSYLANLKNKLINKEKNEEFCILSSKNQKSRKLIFDYDSELNICRPYEGTLNLLSTKNENKEEVKENLKEYLKSQIEMLSSQLMLKSKDDTVSQEEVKDSFIVFISNYFYEKGKQENNEINSIEVNLAVDSPDHGNIDFALPSTVKVGYIDRELQKAIDEFSLRMNDGKNMNLNLKTINELQVRENSNGKFGNYLTDKDYSSKKNLLIKYKNQNPCLAATSEVRQELDNGLKHGENNQANDDDDEEVVFNNFPISNSNNNYHGLNSKVVARAGQISCSREERENTENKESQNNLIQNQKENNKTNTNTNDEAVIKKKPELNFKKPTFSFNKPDFLTENAATNTENQQKVENETKTETETENKIENENEAIINPILSPISPIQQRSYNNNITEVKVFENPNINTNALNTNENNSILKTQNNENQQEKSFMKKSFYKDFNIKDKSDLNSEFDDFKNFDRLETKEFNSHVNKVEDLSFSNKIRKLNLNNIPNYVPKAPNFNILLDNEKSKKDEREKEKDNEIEIKKYESQPSQKEKTFNLNLNNQLNLHLNQLYNEYYHKDEYSNNMNNYNNMNEMSETGYKTIREFKSNKESELLTQLSKEKMEKMIDSVKSIKNKK